MDINNRRQFFIDYARDKGLDPLIPETWYKISQNSIVSIKIKRGSEALLMEPAQIPCNSICRDYKSSYIWIPFVFFFVFCLV